MNSWWLKLYTIPQCKTTLKYFAIANFLVATGLYFFPEKLGFIMLAFGLPAFGFFGGIQNGLHANLDFHKMHVPLKKLRKIFIYDMLIQVTLYFVLFFLSFWVPILLTQLKYWQLHPFILAVGTPSFTVFISAIVFSFVYTIRSAKPLKMAAASNKDDIAKRRKLTFIFMIPAILFVMFDDGGVDPTGASTGSWAWLEFLFKFNFIFMAAGFFLCMLVGGIYSSTVFNFNLKKSSIKNHFMTFGKAFAFAAVFCFICGGLSYFEFNSDLYGRTHKMKALIVFSDFVPELEVETVKQLLPRSDIYASNILKKAHPDFYQVPVEEVLKTNDLRLVAEYIYYGKPSRPNLIYLMREFESKPDAKEWKNDKYYKTVRKLLVYRAPEAKSLPDDLIHEKIETKKERAVASEKKGP